MKKENFMTQNFINPSDGVIRQYPETPVKLLAVVEKLSDVRNN